MKYLKLFEDIEWKFDEDEEFDLNYPIHLKELSYEEYENLLKELKVGDRFNFTFKKNIRIINSDGIIRYICKNKNFIGIEFDKDFNGHSGDIYFNGKDGHCWFFNNEELNYGLIINKRV